MNQGTFSDYHGVEPTSLLLMLMGSGVGVDSKSGIFINGIVNYLYYMNEGTSYVGSRLSKNYPDSLH